MTALHQASEPRTLEELYEWAMAGRSFIVKPGSIWETILADFDEPTDTKPERIVSND